MIFIIKKYAGILTGIFFILLSTTKITFAAAVVPTDTALDGIANNKTWQHLILWRNNQAEVQSQGFYLVADNQRNPTTELYATLKLFAEDTTAKCRFPARYYWLSTQLPFAFLKDDLVTCSNIPKHINNLSLILISGYLSNPASTFGHVLITLQPFDSNRLLADSYNYGAKVPPNENSIAYIVKGLFGFYDATFTKSDFFKHDATYSRLEQRDMWEYELNLTEQEKKLVHYHLFEITNHNFNYYFIKQNCAYRVGELLEFIDGLDVVNRKTPWYAPEYIAHQVTEYDQNEQSKRKLVRNIEYHPSIQTRVYQAFDAMDASSQDVINDSISKQNLQKLANLSTDQQIQVLDFLLDYVEFKSVTETDAAKYQNFKKDIVKSRIALPISNEQTQTLDKLPPTAGAKPSKLQVFTGNTTGVGLTLFQKDPLNDAVDIDTVFRAVDIKYQYRDKQSKELDLDLIKIRKFEDLSQKLKGEKKLSWEIGTGFSNDAFDTAARQHYVQGGVGGAYKILPNSLIYQMFVAVIHDQDKHYDLTMNTGWIYKNDFASLNIEFERRVREGNGYKDQYLLMLRKALNKDYDLRLQWLKKQDLKQQVNFGISYYW